MKKQKQEAKSNPFKKKYVGLEQCTTLEQLKTWLRNNV
jgi:hypothetical protein